MSSQLRLTLYAALATMTTATALISVFSSSGWVVPVIGAIILVAASCAAVRATTLPSAFEPIVAAVVILFWVSFLDARSSSHLGFIPGRTGFRHLDHAAHHGFNEIHRLPTPAPAHHGLVMLTVVGVAAVALVVDLMVVTLRRAALAGLPLLALFTVCAATGHHGVGILSFLLAAIGYLWLLYADNREKVARWGAAVGTGSRARPASAWSTDASSAPPPASLGRRVGATAISLGVVVPILIPGLHTGIDKHGTGTGPGGDGNDGTTIVRNPIVSVASDLKSTQSIPVFSYQSSATNPGYTRLTSLDSFNGTTFSASSLREPASATAGSHLNVANPVPRATSTNPTVTTTVHVQSNAKLRYLPIPMTTVGTNVDSSWRYDPASATVFSSATTTAGLTYTTQSIANDPTAAELKAAAKPDGTMAADLALPQSAISPKVTALTKHVTAGATSDYQAAIDIQNFFTQGDRFTYSTDITKDNSPQALTHFLLDTRTGFCQQYATAMAVMARIYGIPARVAVGFTAGTLKNGVYQVTTHDAHAWPELYFPGYGWLPFEPTPRADGQAVAPNYAHAKGAVTPNPGASAGASAQPRHNPLANSTGKSKTDHAGSGGSGHNIPAIGTFHGTSYTAALTVLIVIAALLLLAIPGLARLVVRRRRWRALSRDPGATRHGIGVAWAELRDSMLDLGVPWDDGRTPRQIATSLLAVAGPQVDIRGSLQRLARFEERARYAAVADATDAGGRHDIDLVREAVGQGCSRGQRLRAVALPVSTLRVAGVATRSVTGVFYKAGAAGRVARQSLTSRARLRARASSS